MKKPNGKLDIETAGFGACSDWLDLNDPCNCANLQHSCVGRTQPEMPVEVSDKLVTDPTLVVGGTITLGETTQHLNAQNSRKSKNQ